MVWCGVRVACVWRACGVRVLVVCVYLWCACDVVCDVVCGVEWCGVAWRGVGGEVWCIVV